MTFPAHVSAMPRGLALGTRLFGNRSWGENLSRKTMADLVAMALEHDVRTMDTAPIYGLGAAETALGEILKPYRNTVTLVTKGGVRWEEGKVRISNDKTTLLADITGSLHRLRTDYVDIFLVHWPDDATPDMELMATLEKILISGKARAVGLSNWPADRLRTCLATGIPTVVQLECHLLRPFSEGYRELFSTYRPVTMAYSPLALGMLTDKYTTPPVMEKNDSRNKHPWFHEPLFSKVRTFINKLKNISPEANDHFAHFALAYAQTECQLAVVGARSTDQLKKLLPAHTKTLAPKMMEDIAAIYRETFDQAV